MILAALQAYENCVLRISVYFLFLIPGAAPDLKYQEIHFFRGEYVGMIEVKCLLHLTRGIMTNTLLYYAVS